MANIYLYAKAAVLGLYKNVSLNMQHMASTPLVCKNNISHSSSYKMIIDILRYTHEKRTLITVNSCCLW
jgi:hypothetical protein